MGEHRTGCLWSPELPKKPLSDSILRALSSWWDTSIPWQCPLVPYGTEISLSLRILSLGCLRQGVLSCNFCSQGDDVYVVRMQQRSKPEWILCWCLLPTYIHLEDKAILLLLLLLLIIIIIIIITALIYAQSCQFGLEKGCFKHLFSNLQNFKNFPHNSPESQERAFIFYFFIFLILISEFLTN